MDKSVKIVVGRDKRDNSSIARHYDRKTDILLRTLNIPGPIVLMPGGGTRGTEQSRNERILMAASICIRYAKAPDHHLSEIKVNTPEGQEIISSYSMPPEKAGLLMIN